MDSLKVKKLNFSEFPPVSTEEWEAVIEQDLKGKNYKEVLKWNPENEIELLPFYRREHLDELQHEPNPVGASGNWSIIQPIVVNDPKSANKKALNALQNGAAGLSFTGKKGVIDSQNDFKQLLYEIQIELINLQFSPALFSAEMANWLNALCKRRGLNPQELSVHFGIDPFVHALQTGKLPSLNTIKDYLENIYDVFNFSVNTAFYTNSGANIVQQLAFALGAGNEFLGMNEKLAPKLRFNFAAGPAYFLEIAKFRTFKLLWTQVLSEYKQAEAPVSFQAETALWNKAQNDAHNNLLRATTEAMSAIIGGCDSIIVHHYNAHFEEPSEFSSRIARNIQLILQEEAYFDKVADPGAGSYYIEMLTDKISKESWKLFQQIEEKGGFYECLKSGFVQDEIQKSREKKVQAYKEKKKVLVGVNKYQPEEMIQNLKFKIQDYSIPDPDDDITEIEKVQPLNMEAELQEGEA